MSKVTHDSNKDKDIPPPPERITPASEAPTPPPNRITPASEAPTPPPPPPDAPPAPPAEPPPISEKTKAEMEAGAASVGADKPDEDTKPPKKREAKMKEEDED